MKDIPQLVSRRIEEHINTAHLLMGLADEIAEAGRLWIETLKSGGKIILFGNGGSFADAQHIAAELVGRFKTDRRPLPALALGTNLSSLTSIGNDYDFETIFIREVEAYGKPGDLAVPISTSGKSPNVNVAAKRAGEFGLTTLALIGRDGGDLKTISEYSIIVPSSETPRIQECHILIGHILCEIVDSEITGQDPSADKGNDETG